MAEHLGITEGMDWLRPYLVLRILGVYNLGELATSDAALSLAYAAEVLSADVRLDRVLGLVSGPRWQQLDRWAGRA